MQEECPDGVRRSQWRGGAGRDEARLLARRAHGQRGAHSPMVWARDRVGAASRPSTKPSSSCSVRPRAAVRCAPPSAIQPPNTPPTPGAGPRGLALEELRFPRTRAPAGGGAGHRGLALSLP